MMGFGILNRYDTFNVEDMLSNLIKYGDLPLNDNKSANSFLISCYYTYLIM